MNYLGANMKLIVECSQKLVRLGENLWGKEQELDKEMQEHQKLCDEIMAIQGIDPIEAEIEEVWHCPDGYIFKDENGNAINATKIVLEKKKKEVILSQEQIDTMVHESCVLFCKYCGCGVPKETCTSLGTCKDHDEYRKSMRTYLENHKK